MPLTLPDGVLGMADRGPDWADWVDRLPRMVSELSDEWGLETDGIPMHGFVGLVVPVLAEGRPAALKISFPEDETDAEHLALRRWGGRGAVALLRADPELVVVVTVPGPPAEFQLQTVRGSTRLPSDVSPRVFIEEIRRARNAGTD